MLFSFCSLERLAAQACEPGIGYAITSESVDDPFEEFSLYRIELTTGNATLIGAPTPDIRDFPTAGEIIDDILYFADDDSLYALDLNSNINTAIAELPDGMATPQGGFSGLEVDPSTGIIYALITDGRIYTFDLATSSFTLVGDLGDFSVLIELVIDEAGNGYVIELSSNAIIPIDPATATLDGPAVAIVESDGTTPINLNFGQDYDFDCPTNSSLLYGGLFDIFSFTARFGTLDPVTGIFTEIEDIGATQYSTFAICQDTVDEEPEPIPTMGAWAVLILGFMVVIHGIVGVRDLQRKTATA